MHPILVTTTEMLNQIRAFEANFRAEALLVDPAKVRAENPDVDPALFLFGELPYYQLTTDDRSQVDAETREMMEQMERTLMRYVFNAKYCTLPYQLLYLENQGMPVYFQFDGDRPLVWLRLTNGNIFYIDIHSYMSVNPNNTGDTP
jgi:hypothetical protein